MKKIVFLLAILGCLLFCGCSSSTDIEYGIDTDNNAYIQIKINVNAADISALDKSTNLQTTLKLLESHYRTKCGFTSDYDFFKENEDTAYLTLTKTVASDSFEEAFENLKEMLCDESLSVFSELSCELSDTEDEYSYRINGRVDMHSVLEHTYNSGSVKGITDYIKEQMEYCSFSVTMVMPENSKVYRLSYTEPTEITHEGKISCVDGITVTRSEINERDTYLKNMLILLGIISTLAFAGIIIGIILIKKRNKLEVVQADEKDNVT